MSKKLSYFRSKVKEGKGFSLVELLVVVVILGILAAIAIPLFLNQRTKAHDSDAMSAVRNLSSKIAAAYASKPSYVTGSGTSATAAQVDIGGVVEDKNGASVFADVDGSWCVSQESVSGNVFVSTSVNRSTYQGELPCLSSKTNPAEVGSAESVITQRPITDGLVLYLDPSSPKSYPGSGDQWYDLVSSDNDMTLVNSPTWSGDYFTFNNSWADGGDNDSLESENITVEVFTKATDEALLGHVRNIVGKGDWNGWHWYLGYKSGIDLSFSYRTGPGGWLIGPKYSIGNFDAAQWHHIVGVCEGTSLKLYIDGVLVSENNAATSVVNTSANDYSFQIARSSYTANTYKGDIGAVRIYNKALTEEEINYNYDLDSPKYG